MGPASSHQVGTIHDARERSTLPGAWTDRESDRSSIARR